MIKMIMKKSDLFKIGVLLMVMILGIIGCFFGEDEKKLEIVVDFVEKIIEYYIVGKVMEGMIVLFGVEVKVGEVMVMMDVEGVYKLIVDSKKMYIVIFSKEGYMSIDNVMVIIVDNVVNCSMVSLSVKLSKKVLEKEVKVDVEEEVVVIDKGDSNIFQVEVVVIIFFKVIEIIIIVSVILYEELVVVIIIVILGNNVEILVVIVNIEVEIVKEVILVKLVILVIINKVLEYIMFENVEVYNQKIIIRVGENWNKVVDVIYDLEMNSYKFILFVGVLLFGKYLMCVKSSKIIGKEWIGEINKEEKKSNEGNMIVILEYKINFEVMVGWEYIVSLEKVLMNVGVDVVDV